MKLTSSLASLALALPMVSAASSFSGSNLFYAAGLNADQQGTLFTGLKDAGVKVLRVWLDGQSGTRKGTKLQDFNSLEGDSPGDFDDGVLEKLDDFMANAQSYGIKLLISMHSYNTLQANNDFYGQWYGTGDFYSSDEAKGYFKDRIKHILSHKNPNNGKTWAQSSEYIFAFEAQNEAMHEQENPDALQTWQCEMAGAIKDNLDGDILVATGGGAWLDNSLLDGYFSCGALDVLSIHAYGTGDFDTDKLKGYVSKAQDSGKKLIMQEWGSCYTDAPNENCNGGSPIDSGSRDSNIKKWTASIAASGIPQFYWQILPNEDPHEDWDYEVGIDGVNWEALKSASADAAGTDSAFDWSGYV